MPYTSLYFLTNKSVDDDGGGGGINCGSIGDGDNNSTDHHNGHHELFRFPHPFPSSQMHHASQKLSNLTEALKEAKGNVTEQHFANIKHSPNGSTPRAVPSFEKK